MSSRVKERYTYWKNTMSFATRLFVSFFAVTIPLMLAISGFLYIFLGRNARESTAKMMLQTLERTKNQVEYIFSETEYLSRNIIYDEDVQQMLKEAAGGNAYPEEEAVKYFINSFIVNREYMDSVVLLGNEAALFSTEKATTEISTLEHIQEKWWFPFLDSESRPFQWFTSARSGARDTDQSLMLTRVIRSTDDYKTPLGRMMIYISEEYLETLWANIQWGENPRVWVLDEDGQIICQNSPKTDTPSYLKQDSQDPFAKIESRIIRYNGRRYVVGSEYFDNHPWRMIIAVPFSEVDESQHIIPIQIGVMIISFLSIMVCAVFVISRNVSRPVECISEIMDSYHDHSNGGSISDKAQLARIVKTFEGRRDEVGKIYRSYEQMVQRVDHMIKEIYLKDLEKKDAELALMQSQINPHFLYNTLDSINWLAMVNGQDEISEMVTALSDTFRLSLRRSNSPYVKIGQELEYLDSYMVLQKIRFGEKLRYSSLATDEIQSLYMLRFVLQPIVENAIKHGIGRIPKGGAIEIRFFCRDGCLCIDVANDGAEIDLSQMQRILAFDMETDPFLNFMQNGYGLQNINRRIKIVHGGAYGLSYKIQNGTQTCCRITLPIIRKDVEPGNYTNHFANKKSEEVSHEA